MSDNRLPVRRKLREATDPVKQKVRDWIYEKLGEDFEDALALEAHEAIPEYDPEWCVELETSEYKKARNAFLDAVLDELFTYHNS